MLFIVKMNSLGKALPPAISYFMNGDDVQISCNMSICERQFQLGVKKLAGCAEKNGYKLNPAKSSCAVFSRKRAVHQNPDISLKGMSHPVNNEHMFLGVAFDRKLRIIHKIKQLEHKRLKTINTLKVLSHQSYGAEKGLLLHLYTSLIGFCLD